MKIQAHVTKGKGEAFTIEEVELQSPKKGEVLVQIVGSGVCHTDMLAQDQDYPVPLPAVLGHEGAGIVVEVGEGVTSVQPGDHVALSFTSCGGCKSCKDDQPFACFDLFNLNFAGHMTDGTHRLHMGEQPLSTFFGHSSFATYSVTNEANVVKVDKDVDITILGPLGCGIQTGAGAVLNAIKPKAGDSFAVFGAGAVGLSAVMAAKSLDLPVIIAVDIHNNRLELAKELGATHTFNPKEVDVVAEIRKVTNGGVNGALETAGIPAVLRQVIDSLTVLGTAAIVGAPPFGAEVNVDINDMIVMQKRIIGVAEGHSYPQVFIPQLVALHKAGKFPFDKIVKVYPFEELNQAVEDSKSGKTIKPVIKMV